MNRSGELTCALTKHDWVITKVMDKPEMEIAKRHFVFKCNSCGIEVKYFRSCVCKSCIIFFRKKIKEESSPYHDLPTWLLEMEQEKKANES